MLKICLVFWKSEPQYAYKRYAYKRKNMQYTLMEMQTDVMIVGFGFEKSEIYHDLPKTTPIILSING